MTVTSKQAGHEMPSAADRRRVGLLSWTAIGGGFLFSPRSESYDLPRKAARLDPIEAGRR